MASCCGSTQRPRGPAVLIAVLLTGALAAALRLSNPGSAPVTGSDAANPAERVAAMIAAEKAGDVAAYVACFDGPLRDTIQARMAQGSTAQHAEALRQGAADLTGHALTRRRTGEDSAGFILERIYRTYNERQRIELARSGGRWSIVTLRPLERYAPEIPYGTPVAPPAQE